MKATAQLTVAWPGGSSVTVGYGGGYHLTLDVGIAPAERGHLTGLLGNDDTDPAGDLVTRSGTVLPAQPTPADLYGAFSASWRLTQAESLFDYPAGQSTATFTDLTFPSASTAPPQSTLDAAAATCRGLGVTTQPYLADCILDVATTGDPSAGLAARAAQTYQLPTAGNLVANGGFEATPSNGIYNEYGTGSTAIPAWTVGGSSVDVVTDGYWLAAEDHQSIDLAGNGPGSLTQTVATTPGAKYTLGWSLAGNTNCGAGVKTLTVTWNGTAVATPTFDTTGTTNNAMGYVHGQTTVTVTGPSAQLTFADTTPGDSLCGPVLDNVTLSPR